jgi:hypothetical protein
MIGELGDLDARLSSDEWYAQEARLEAKEREESEARLDRDEAEQRGDFDRLHDDALARSGTYVPHDQRPPTDSESLAESIAKMKARNRSRESESG